MRSNLRASFGRRATHVSCPEAFPMRTASLCHRLSNLGVTAVTGAYVVPTAACTVTVCPAGGSAALTIFQSRDIAFMLTRTAQLAFHNNPPQLAEKLPVIPVVA